MYVTTPLWFAAGRHAVLTAGGRSLQASLTEDDVKSFVAGRVAEYKNIGEVAFVDAIPKSASGKILKRLLK